MTAVILFVSGAIIGSFLNVVALRWNEKNFGGRSKCGNCSNILRWYELIPVISFLIQQGQCRKCGAKISYQYPLVEIWTGLIFATVPYIFLPVFCLYVVITIYDAHHKIIPDSLVYASIILALLISHAWVAGLALFLFFASIWLLSKGRAMGFGDAKLGLSIGLLLGSALAFSAIILAFWVGAAYGILAMIFSRKKITMKSAVPFAPFLVLGAWLSLIFDLDLLHVSMF